MRKRFPFVKILGAIGTVVVVLIGYFTNTDIFNTVIVPWLIQMASDYPVRFWSVSGALIILAVLVVLAVQKQSQMQPSVNATPVSSLNQPLVKLPDALENYP